MQPWSGVSDPSARIAEVQAVGAALDDIRHELAQSAARIGEIVLDTRWSSPAMESYRRSVAHRQDDVSLLAMALAVAYDEVRALAGELVLLELQRAAQPGMAVAR